MIKKYWKLWTKSFALELQSDMIYKWNFFIKLIALVIADVVGPIVTILIYSTTAGIPGWTFEEFILFQGCFIITFGILRTLFLILPHHCIKAIRDGSFDKFLVKPFNTLMQLTLSSWNLEGLAEVFTGSALIIWAIAQIGTTFGGFALFVFSIIMAVLFLYSCMVLIAALSFLVVQSYALYDIFFRLADFGRYPLSIYGTSARFLLTFIFPLGIVAFYPASAILGDFSLRMVPEIVLPVAGFFALSIWLWNLAMRKYSSAGG